MLKDIILYKESWLKEHERVLNNYAKTKIKSRRSLKNALSTKESAFICEIKPSSPSAGLLRKNIDIKQITRTYAQFANAISVLADENFFGGSLNNILLASNNCELPILFKDIIISPLQVSQARYFGADAILLMLSVLDNKTYLACKIIADSLNLDIITEINNESELERALRLEAKIIAINNRDLHDLSVDLNTTKKLAFKIPSHIIIISASGFFNQQQISEYKNLVNGFLVGTSLMQASRIDLALRELIFGRVKICGLTSMKDAQLAYECGAYYGGLNFSGLSKHQVEMSEAQAISKSVPLVCGGIFVDQAIEKVLAIATKLSLSFVQLHGNEDQNYIKNLRKRLPSQCAIWRALRIKNFIPDEHYECVDMLLLDNHSENYGGSGQSFDWSLLNNIRNKQNIILAGGLRAENIEEAAKLGVFALDIASGSDTDESPAKKSLIKMKDIFKALRG